jgi:heterodisulfide reductase subunit C
MVKRMLTRLPIKLMRTMGLATVFRPRTSGWGRARAAMEDYAAEQKRKQHAALGLDGTGHDGKDEPQIPAAAE